MPCKPWAKSLSIFAQLGVTALSLTAHKFHGPVGIGALLVRHDDPLEPLLFGGVQQGGSPSGQRVGGAGGRPADGAELCSSRNLRTGRGVCRPCETSFESTASRRFPALEINGAARPRLPHTSNLSFPGLDRQALLMALDLAGVACSTGSACASGSSEPSPVLLAMGLPAEIVDSSLRFSVGAFTSATDIEQAARSYLAELRTT